LHYLHSKRVQWRNSCAISELQQLRETHINSHRRTPWIQRQGGVNIVVEICDHLSIIV